MRKKKVWSPNRYFVSALRRIWRWNPDRKKVKDETKACIQCAKRLRRDQVKVDHIIPVGSAPKGFEGWDAYLSKMFCPLSNLQGLCKSCHQIKTNKERLERKKK